MQADSAVQNAQQALRTSYDELTAAINERTKSRFTREDAEKLVWRVKDVEIAQDAFKDRMQDDLGILRLHVSNLQNSGASSGRTNVAFEAALTGGSDSFQLVTQLQTAINGLRAKVNRLHRMVGVNRGNIHQDGYADEPVDRVSQSRQA